MASNVTPASLRQQQFRTAFRGFEPAEVRAVLEEAARRLEALDTERRKLQSRIDEAPEHRDLENEFENLGREVTSILQSAREAAEAMRERASLDATHWRTEATDEADRVRKEAAADAEALRRDAWVTGSELLQQSSTQAETMRANAERDVLTTMGEAEREAHRLTSAARREAEDAVRNATMDAEKVMSDATSRRDEIIDGANRQASAAQERARALEQRRDELLEELENVRSTLTRLEGSLAERREVLDLTSSSDSSSVRVVHPPAEAKERWELGETVRVIPPEQPERADPDPGLADEVSQEVAMTRAPVNEPEPAPEAVVSELQRAVEMPDAAREGIAESEAPEASEVEEPESGEPGSEEPRSDELEALFASLRGGADTAPPGDVVGDRSPAPTSEEVEANDGVDWIEAREERLLPITNRALRGVKKAVTEIQNVALDRLRTDEGWEPDETAIAEAVHAELVAVWSESFAAGHAAAEQMSGAKVKRPPTPSSGADTQFASALSGAVGAALDKAGEGPRERQSAASRVFRVWRSDEAERRIRSIALSGYEAGIEETRKVSTA
jgi:DivIVA domain-containing protein